MSPTHTDPYARWCEHPCPVELADGKMVCSRCLVRFGEIVEMVPCTPEVCE